jgi:translocation and assembly module TamA
MCLLMTGIAHAADSYRVEFRGVEEKGLLNLLSSSSQLLALTDSPGPTAATIRRRADTDLQRLLKILHNSAYYNAKIKFSFDFDQTPMLVVIDIDLGPVYPIAAFRVEGMELNLNALELRLGEAATPEKILHAEECLLFLLAKKGHPYAKICERRVAADQQTKTVAVTLQVDPGPLMRFGATSIEGNVSVKEAFFQKKIAWGSGMPFDPMKLLETQNALEESRLFRAVNITYPEVLPEGGKIPMKIDVVEAKHRSIGAGISYSTQLGPGVELEWEHRNVRGMGDTLRCDANILGRLQEGSLQYLQRDVWFRHQDLIWTADVKHEVTKGYKETAYSLSSIVRHRINLWTTLSYGAMVTELNNKGSDQNGSFHLFKTPLIFQWNRTDNLLDPSRGGSLFVKLTPTAQFLKPKFIYSVNLGTATSYLSLWNKKVVVAAKGIAGTILGTTRRQIPPSERFYAGSETTLRGYSYMTVSPLDERKKPIGGRSILIGSLELRLRLSEALGLALFYDAGNVYKDPYPNFDEPFLNSLGAGVRYYTSVGPIRFDLAFPLQRRKGIDKSYQFYFSIGQAF